MRDTGTWIGICIGFVAVLASIFSVGLIVGDKSASNRLYGNCIMHHKALPYQDAIKKCDEVLK